ncbi:MAG TPA: DUF4097 family beta strand repeat-containing protein [Gemmatimonadales bacterium]|jgi:hypothetical protein|nr:DUF4097 family beta strand repeat-containing protein [Gemmatimonadales bacterium]
MKRVWILILGAVPVIASAQQPERYVVSGDAVAVYNLAGVLRVEAGSGSDVVVEVTRGGADRARLRVETGPLRDRATLRVIYPGDDIVYRALGRGSNTTLDVRDDGTFNDDHDRRGGHARRYPAGRRVRISGSDDGLDAYADVHIAVPAGKRLEVYLGVGRAFVANVAGELRLDVAAADVTADHTKGSLRIDTGSGDVRLSDAEGTVGLDTGSGNVAVAGMRGHSLALDTGSGDVTAEQVAADDLRIDTGSGGVTASAIRSPVVSISTGSGDVRLALESDVGSLDVDTGSGDVTVTVPPSAGAHVDVGTGSGEIDFQGVALKVTRLEKAHVVGEMGDGKGRLKIETGSGEVRLVRGR